MLYTILILAGIFAIGGIYILNLPQLGKNPTGERLARIEKSPNYKNGEFQNYNSVEQKSSTSRWENLYEIFIKGIENARPNSPIPVVKTDLKTLAPSQNTIIWLGHSAYFIQVNGKKILIDPTLVNAAPFAFMNKPFKGTDIYKPNDIPEVDYLLITHDHYDHLDYETIIQIKDGVKNFVVSLGIGEHLEHWGVNPNKITELDWNEDISFDDNVKITALPARHYSGRGIVRNKTLWSSFMLESQQKTIYIGGDSGYDDFYKEIGKKFPSIDIALMENGQYNEDWRYIHILPNQIPQAFNDLKAKRLMTGHHGKYALAKHAWTDPLDNIYNNAKKENLPLLTPKIGEIINLDDETQVFEKWW